ncbi:MAG: hypothetical protein DRG24_05090 [Epsilonproteobacteria bacterium]|nr:MAG: hypothetical protein DRG24_05090 [Campylobacterota bacterium]
MAITFMLPLADDKEVALEHIKTGIIESGGSFEGDLNDGIFAGKTPLGMIKGSYLINANEIEVTINKKPMILSKTAIKSAMEEYMA